MVDGLATLPSSPLERRVIMNKATQKAIRDALKEKGIKVGGRTSPEKLADLAKEHGIKVGTPHKSIVPDSYKKEYGKLGHCNDELAVLLKEFTTAADGGLDVSAMGKVARANSIDLGRWSHLNSGQQRMNLGNVLRARLKRNEHVEVGDSVWNEGNYPEEKKARKGKKAAQ